MSRFRKAWQSLNFYKEYLFVFETLIFATLQILHMHTQLITLQRQGKHEISSYDPFKVCEERASYLLTHKLPGNDGYISNSEVLPPRTQKLPHTCTH